ncbi:hypothetical protein LO771_30445, partial [Streptacidiphilus sp. ASG 303]|uniref:hypothetical protein n=1 Tax=Streptacidiphilus sp. ASG 303 TaxID=2896847 RepID=UPI001E565C8C
LFVPGGGRRTFTASAPAYRPASRTVAVADDRAAAASVVLAAGRLSVGAARIEAATRAHGVVVRRVTVRNSGTAPATLRIGERTGAGPGAAAPD